MFIHCKKTGEEYEITDREIGEKVECPCCGEKFVVDDLVISDGAYTAALIRKTEELMLRNEPKQKLYKHGTESSAALLFDSAYEHKDADAQFQLAKWLFDNERAYPLAAFWFECAAAKKHPEATYRFAECLWNGIGVRKNIDRAVEEYRNAAKCGCDAAKGKAAKFDFAEYKEREAGGKATFAAVQKMIGDAKKFEGYLCAKYNARGVMLFWAEKALPEWGTSKGTSIIIGSFKSEKDVPREMLEEISHLIGRSLSYTGRYVDNGVADNEKFLFSYAVYPTDEEYDTEGAEGSPNHFELACYFESDEWDRDRHTWRDSIVMNCPLCEAEITVPTRLTGGKVRCSHCRGEFMAKGEGIMTAAERVQDRREKELEEESSKFDFILKEDGGPWSALRLSFKAHNYGFYGESIGRGWKTPWMGIYLHMTFEDGAKHNANDLRTMLESILGCWVRYTGENHYYLRQNRPCKRDEFIAVEIEKRIKDRRNAIEKANAEHSDRGVDPLVKSREEEVSRIEYLMWGGRETSRNSFDFLEYSQTRYGISRMFVSNNRPNDAWSSMHNFKDGFGIVVETQEKLSQVMFLKFVQDLERRFSRKLTLVETVEELSGTIEYCFTVSMPNLCTAVSRQTSVRSLSKPYQFSKQRQEKILPMKRTATTLVPQHLGKGSGVDWSRENKAFSEMLVKHGIRKFHVEMVNPYCVEVSIPMTESRSVVRGFANGLLGELGLLEYGGIDFGQFGANCGLDINGGARCYFVIINHHEVVGLKPGSRNYKYTVEAIMNGGDDDDEEDPEIGEGDEPERIMQLIANGIKSGAIRSKSGEGYFVLKGEFYDAIEAGRKTTEYRDLTPRNLSMSIGIKTVKFQRGYGHPGHPPKQMRFEVASVRLMDASDHECDPYAIPPGFIATTIAIHLGKRIG